MKSPVRNVISNLNRSLRSRRAGGNASICFEAVTRTYSGSVTPAAASGSAQVLAGSTLICSATLTGVSSKVFRCTI